MNKSTFPITANFDNLLRANEALITKINIPVPNSNGIFQRYQLPILTAAHTPIHWRYDLNPQTNPYGLERIGINATFNAGAIK